MDPDKTEAKQKFFVADKAQATKLTVPVKRTSSTLLNRLKYRAVRLCARMTCKRQMRTSNLVSLDVDEASAR